MDEQADHLKKLEQTKQQVMRDREGRLQAELDAITVSEEERKEVRITSSSQYSLRIQHYEILLPTCFVSEISNSTVVLFK